MSVTTVALIGNPNSGKTTLFNALTGANQFVGNWPGVTVEKKEGSLRSDKAVRILDLPGIYSLTPFSPEEIVARDALTHAPPDIVLNIVDGTHLERNLYLTMQLLELGLPVVVAVNCADVLRRRGDKFSAKTLERTLCCPVVAISAISGEGLGQLMPLLKQPAKIKTTAHRQLAYLSQEDAIAARYDRIEQAVAQCMQKSGKREVSQQLDRLLLHRVLALPIFAVIMVLVYYISVSGVGAWASNAIEQLLNTVGRALESLLLHWQVLPWLRALVIDGLWAGVGTVVGFVPQMLLLFGCLAFLESCGYLARIAFVLDCLLRQFGLSGKCFMPMLLATGCGVPAILATRAIDSPHERRVTAVTCTFLPCSAKLPIIALVAGAMFGGAWWLAPFAYFIGFAAIIFSAFVLNKTHNKAQARHSFVLELPDYRMPTAKNLLRSVWSRTAAFLKKAGSVILLSSLLVWFLSSVAWKDNRFMLSAGLSQGLLASFGRMLAPLFRPLGFGQWQAVVATVTAFIAKENAVSTLGILYHGNIAAGFTQLSALSFLIFNLLCAPCVAAVSALRRELGSIKRTLAAVGYQCALAYAVAFLVYTAGLVAQ